MHQTTLLCACALLLLLNAAMMTSARPSAESEGAEYRLQDLLLRLLQGRKAGGTKHACDNKDCGTGRCGGGENPHDWDEAYYCFDCNGPNNDKTNGGQRCEIADPCGRESENSPCRTPEKPRCSTSSMELGGYYCTSLKRSALSSLLEHLEEDADQEEYHEVRMMIARSESPEEGLAEFVRYVLE